MPYFHNFYKKNPKTSLFKHSTSLRSQADLMIAQKHSINAKNVPHKWEIMISTVSASHFNKSSKCMVVSP